MIKNIILILIGIGGGVLEGAGIASFLALLDIVPRLSQITKSSNRIRIYEKVIILASVFISLTLFLDIKLYLKDIFLIPIGLSFGIYVGLLAAALAEVLNVIPVLERRLNLKEYIFFPLIALSLGKIVGSLVQWLIFWRY